MKNILWRYWRPFGLALFVSVLATGTPAAAQESARSQLVDVRGTRLYVEIAGPPSAPPLLYLHGGPGTGSYDFARYQRDRLGRTTRLIMIDQRGVLRSDPLEKGQTLRPEDIVEDCEALRKVLGIQQWAVLGHSFGGYLALQYATKYPQSVSAVVFENPSFDLSSSARSIAQGAAALLRAQGRSDEEAQALAHSTENASAVWDKLGVLLGQLGNQRDRLYVHGDDVHFFDRLVTESGLGQAWQNSAAFHHALLQGGAIYASVTPLLSELTMPALLIHGKYDLVTDPAQLAAFQNQAKRGRQQEFNESAHFVHVEQADAFADTVSAFVRTSHQ